jgi:hypothetical protein
VVATATQPHMGYQFCNSLGGWKRASGGLSRGSETIKALRSKPQISGQSSNRVNLHKCLLFQAAISTWLSVPSDTVKRTPYHSETKFQRLRLNSSKGCGRVLLFYVWVFKFLNNLHTILLIASVWQDYKLLGLFQRPGASPRTESSTGHSSCKVI